MFRPGLPEFKLERLRVFVHAHDVKVSRRVYQVRAYGSELLFAQRASEPQRLELAGIDVAAGRYHDLLGDEMLTVDAHVELGPYQVRWLEAQATSDDAGA